MDSDVDPAVQARVAAAASRASAALQALSINDVFEMRSFVTPPPAVMLVSCALTLLLTGRWCSGGGGAGPCVVQRRGGSGTGFHLPLCVSGLHNGTTSFLCPRAGKAMDWRDAKRTMGNADKLFGNITSLDKNSVPSKRVLSLIDLFQNPCLSQEVLRPVSGAVARVAEWVHATALYAGAVKDLQLPESRGFSLPRIPSVEEVVFGGSAKPPAPAAGAPPGAWHRVAGVHRRLLVGYPF